MEQYTVAAAVLEGITAHAAREQPHECCGLLLGSEGRVVAFREAANTAAQPCTHYTIDPVDHFAAVRQARHDGLDVVGAYHSHPATAPVPSATDRAEAFPHFLFVIVSLASQPPEVKGWHLVEGNFVPTRLVRTA
jgi:proteasome lid subunit RPN8/RPN11